MAACEHAQSHSPSLNIYTQHKSWGFANDHQYYNTGLSKRISPKDRGVTLYPGIHLHTLGRERANMGHGQGWQLTSHRQPRREHMLCREWDGKHASAVLSTAPVPTCLPVTAPCPSDWDLHTRHFVKQLVNTSDRFKWSSTKTQPSTPTAEGQWALDNGGMATLHSMSNFRDILGDSDSRCSAPHRTTKPCERNPLKLASFRFWGPHQGRQAEGHGKMTMSS